MKGDHTTIVNQESDMYREEYGGKKGKCAFVPLVGSSFCRRGFTLHPECREPRRGYWGRSLRSPNATLKEHLSRVS